MLKILLEQGDKYIGFTKFSNIPNEHFEGETLSIIGWQRQESRHNSLVLNK